MESLITRIRTALLYGLTVRDIAEKFSEDGTPEEIWLAYQAALLLDRFANEEISR